MVEKYRCFFFFCLPALFCLVLPGFPVAEELQDGKIRQEAMDTVFSGREEMHFTISWTGGVKIGDLFLTLKRIGNDEYEIHARITDYGLFKFFYPVDDVFDTRVRGAFKLPYQYDVLQREGRGSVTRRQSLYDQEKLVVVYRKNDSPEQAFDISRPVHNEFSSFYITRSMDLEPGGSFVVPTFADKKVNEVKVKVGGPEDIDSPFGRVRTLVVMPLMKFRGLFDKDGDTIIWLTDDLCRVPVKIRSKILIGSLTAELDDYANPACERY
ncbi:MAG TPA: DUF3108 domain-containing protein [Desulfobacteraceae bacterium]|nr:DUF3108 domain-containing protein [Desulfobacteraceae bacterium]